MTGLHSNTVLWPATVLAVSLFVVPKKKKRNHINISLGERISASNGTGLEGKRLESAEGREDEAGQRWCIIEEGALPFWKHAAAEMEKFRQTNLLSLRISVLISPC